MIKLIKRNLVQQSTLQVCVCDSLGAQTDTFERLPLYVCEGGTRVKDML